MDHIFIDLVTLGYLGLLNRWSQACMMDLEYETNSIWAFSVGEPMYFEVKTKNI